MRYRNTWQIKPKKGIGATKSKFDATNLEEFRSSCFGAYLDFPNPLTLQGPVIYLLLQKLTTSASEGSLTFNLNGVEATFGPKEFLMVFGLSFVPVKPIAHASNFARSMVVESGTVKAKDIKDQFIQVCDLNHGGGEEALLIGWCLFVYGVLFGLGFSNHPVDCQYMNQFDEFNSFHKFAWGRVAYDYLLIEFHSSKAVVSKQSKKQKNVSVDIYGLALAIHVWAFEVFSDIGSMRNHNKLIRHRNEPHIVSLSCPHKLFY